MHRQNGNVKIYLTKAGAEGVALIYQLHKRYQPQGLPTVAMKL